MIDWQLHRPSHVVELLRAHDITTSRRQGQNFLVDANVLRKVVDAAELTASDCVVEIGAGLGILTHELAERAGRVIAIEKDRRCFAALQETTSQFTNIDLLHADVLEVDLAGLVTSERLTSERLTSRRAKVVANLPYSISKEILRRVFDARANLERAVLMLQREVAERLLAKPGSKSYGPLAIAAYLLTDTELIAIVSPNSFLPPPKVKSAIIRLRFLTEARESIDDERWFFTVVKAALRERRKTLFNALISSLEVDRSIIAHVLSDCEIDGRRRGGTLTPAEFVRLANALRSVS